MVNNKMLNDLIQMYDLYTLMKDFYNIDIDDEGFANALMVLVGRYNKKEMPYVKEMYNELVEITKIFKNDIEEIAEDRCEDEKWIKYIKKTHPILNEVEPEEAN